MMIDDFAILPHGRTDGQDTILNGMPQWWVGVIWCGHASVGVTGV